MTGFLKNNRVASAQARDGLFFKAVGNVHPRFETPHISIAVQGVWAAVLAISGSYERLFSYVIFTDSSTNIPSGLNIDFQPWRSFFSATA